jgi:N-acetylneuraminic acid mutarotase
MLLWGGSAGTLGGFRYDPALDAWAPMSRAGEPSDRDGHRGVWTGTELIVWGGSAGPGNTGGRYDPETDTWRPTSTAGAPDFRTFYTAVWTGSEMLVWGGETQFSEDRAGRLYDPVTDTWRPMSTAGQPMPRQFASAVWTGTELIVWGGQRVPPGQVFNDGGRYDPASDTWSPVSRVGAPSARATGEAVWTGSEMIVWGGTIPSTGARYDPATDTWRPTSRVNQPTGRNNFSTVWTGSEMIVWGGGPEYANGGRYCALPPRK